MNHNIQERWEAYQIRIISSPTFAGMPDLYNTDGSVQWEAPSNRRGTGPHVHTHQRRKEWWEAKAQSIGIDVNTPMWISRTARQIHPTKTKTCKGCGLDMDIRYVYPNARFVNKLRRLEYLTELLNDPFADIYDITEFIYLNDQDAAPALVQSLLKTSTFTQVPAHESFEELKIWLDDIYVPAEPSLLSPGAMSNAPDRLDGFHSFNRCCRSVKDKGRSKENWATYTGDRRSFENWTGGNWVAANRLMGLFRILPMLRDCPCSNTNSKQAIAHDSIATPDHIGPISLGFTHRPVFRVLCKSCNSAKNNRMTPQDLTQLLADEASGEEICCWYLQPIWELGKTETNDSDSLDAFNRILRDNRGFAFNLLSTLHAKEYFLALSTLLSLEYGFSKWEPDKDSVHVTDSIATASFIRTDSAVKYRSIQLNRYLRVSFDSLAQYAVKDSRNTATKVDFLKTPDLSDIEAAAQSLETKNQKLAQTVKAAILDNKNLTIHDFKKLLLIQSTREVKIFYAALNSYMEQVARVIWDNRSQSRYTRASNLQQ